MNTLPWYDRLYVWTRKKWFSETDEQAMKSNTCKYLRTLFIWTPILIAVHVLPPIIVGVLIVGITYSITAFMMHYGLMALLYLAITIGIVIGIALLMISTILLIMFVLSKFPLKIETVISKKWNFPDISWFNTPFWTRVKQTIKDYHDKVCSEIDLSKSKV